MLTESQLRALPTPLWRAFQRLETAIIETICGRIRQIGELTATDVHRLDELQRIGFDMTAIQREVASTLNMATREVYDIFFRASEMQYQGVRAMYDLTGRAYIPFADNQQLQELVHSIARATADTFMNMSGTTGFMNPRDTFGRLIRDATGRVAPRFQPLAQYYQSVIDYATLQVRTGQTDFHSTMHETIRVMADHGYQSVDYASGYRRRMDTAVRANMMDAQARLSRAQSEIVGQQIGADGREISWHSAPRPSHEWIGGIQVDLDTFYRSVLPVMQEWNCLHRDFPILLGISVPTYTQSELDEMNARDREPREYNGKTYTAYGAQEEQRRQESRIRAQKDRVIAFNASGDKESAKASRARARTYQAQYARFSNAVGVGARKDRTRVSGYH